MTSNRTIFVGFDVGTQSTKALALDADTGRILARSSHRHSMLSGLPPGSAEQNPDEWIDAVAATSRALLRDGIDPRTVGGIGVSGQQHGLCAVGDDGRCVRPAKLWCDTATTAEAEELSRALGRPIPCGYTASKILWLKRREPENWARVRRILLPHDYVNFRLTGRAVTEAGDASGTGLFDPVARRFDDRAADAIGPEVADMLPEVLEAGELAGVLDDEGAALTGLPKGCPVAGGGGDNMMSAIGAGVTRPGVVCVSLGTSGTVFACSERPIHDPTGAIAEFCDSTGRWLPLLCVMNMTGVTEEMRNLTGMSHAQLTEAARATPSGADGLTFVPYLTGERTPNLPLATGTITGLRPGLATPGHLYRAAIEGTTLGLVFGIERLKRAGIAVESVRLAGGGARNPLWREVLADVSNTPVEPLVEAESAALGAAVQALWTVRRLENPKVDVDDLARRYVSVEPEPIRPRSDRVRTYSEVKRRFADAVRRLHDVDLEPPG